MHIWMNGWMNGWLSQTMSLVLCLQMHWKVLEDRSLHLKSSASNQYFLTDFSYFIFMYLFVFGWAGPPLQHADFLSLLHPGLLWFQCTASRLTSSVAAHRLSCPPACVILIPRPGIKPESSCTGGQILNHWTTREVPHVSYFKGWYQKYLQRFISWFFFFLPAYWPAGKKRRRDVFSPHLVDNSSEAQKGETAWQMRRMEMHLLTFPSSSPGPTLLAPSRAQCFLTVDFPSCQGVCHSLVDSLLPGALWISGS